MRIFSQAYVASEKKARGVGCAGLAIGVSSGAPDGVADGVSDGVSDGASDDASGAWPMCARRCVWGVFTSILGLVLGAAPHTVPPRWPQRP